MRILISACLLGVNCRYDGGDNLVQPWVEALAGHELIPVCPEQLGGMTTPRLPSEIVSEAPTTVLAKDGTVVTGAFAKGAGEALKLARLFKAECAILKERSPSCGVNRIYDGTFSGVRIPGQGMTARLLAAEGLRLYSEEELDRFLETEAHISLKKG